MTHSKRKKLKMIGLKNLKMPKFNTRIFLNTFCLFAGFLLVLILPTSSKAAEVTFNKVFKGTGTGYNRNTNSIAVTNPLVGSSFKFISKNPADPTFFAGGNDIEGNLQYLDGGGNIVTLFGTVSRKSATGSVDESFYFGVLTPLGVYTGEAYELIMTPHDALYPGNQNISTNSAGVEAGLNAYLSFQQSKTFNLSATTGSVSETGTKTSFTIVLASQPSSNVVLNLTPNDATEASSDKSTLTFTNGNWNTPQTVTITGVDDNLIDGPQNTIYTISVNAALSDNNFDNAASKTYTVTTTDNDVAGFTLSSTSGSVSESGATKTFTIVLTAQPTSNVVLSLVSATVAEATVSPATLTFTTANWNAAQTVTVTGVDDALVDGNQNSIITVAVVDADSDNAFDPLANQTYTATNLDNDGAPSISGPGGAIAPATAVASISIPENTTPVFTYTASKAVTWTLSGTDAAKFLIAADGSLTFNPAPDFETPGDSNTDNDYIVIVTGTDNTPVATSQTLTVTVTNVDDTAPNLIGPGGSTAPATATSAISIPENTTPVFTFTSNETPVTWSISGTDAALFTIGTDGKLVFNAAPDFELPGDSDNNNTYIVVVKARDAAGNETTQTLTVTVTNVDDTAPSLVGPGGSTSPATATSAISIPENTTPVFTFTSNETVTWSISGTDAALFTIGTDGKLVFKVAPDFELPSDSNKDNIYVIIVKAVDAAGNETIQTLLVTVSDVDDTAPVISGPAGSKGATATISVPENGTAVFSYTADESVTWSISGTDASLFTIGTDGKLVFKVAPNFELPSDSDKNNSYILVITAKDASNNSSTQTLTVNVLNVNEVPTNLSLTTSVIYENNVLNALIGYLGSSDVDAGDTFKYSIVGGDTGSFIITGNELKANDVFVYGTKSNYTIILRTTDAGGLSFDKTVNISIAEAPKLFGIANQPGNKKSAASGGNVTISKGYSVNLNLSGSNIVSYNWSPSTGLNSTNISNPTANPTKTTTYTVTVTNAQGISTTLYITVTVIEDYNITPNNVISPNGDGVNDVWVIENLSAYPNNEVKLFDKAGRVIFNVKNYQNNWNGQLNGQLLHDGAYYYVISLGAGSRAKVGYITLFSNQ